MTSGQIRRGSTQDLLGQAFGLHQAGRLDEAERLYVRILSVDKKNFDALQLFGMLQAQRGNLANARELLVKALRIEPRSADVLINLGNVLRLQGQLEDALDAYGKVLAIQPNSILALNNQGSVLSALRRFNEARRSFDSALKIKPDYPDTLYNRGKLFMNLSLPAEALADLDKARSIQPNDPEVLVARGNALLLLARIEDAMEAFSAATTLQPAFAEAWVSRAAALRRLNRLLDALADDERALTLRPNYADAFCGRGLTLHALKRFDEALASLDRAVALRGDFTEAHHNRARTLFELGRLDEALAAFDQALTLNPDFLPARCGRGTVLLKLKRHSDALAAYDAALARDGNLAEAWLGRANVYAEFKQYDQALAAYESTLAQNPDFAEAHCGRGNALINLARCDEALVAYDAALARDSDLAEAWLGRANVSKEFRQYSDAIGALDRALALKSDFAQAWISRGNVLIDLKRHDDAYAAYDKALAIDPNSADAWFGRGFLSNARRDYESAIAEYSRALQLDPNRDFLKGILLYQHMLCCEWDNFDAQVHDIENDIYSNKPSAEPFGWLGLAAEAQSLQRCAKIYSAIRYPARRSEAQNGWFVEDGVKRRIRIGYLSGEFREQATSFLIIGLLEGHNKSAFEVFGFDNGWDDRSATRERIVGALDTIVPIRNLSDASAVDLIRRCQIDILVNLNGYFGEERTAIFARRPAPIQVNYLGFPGTLGTTYMDYIVADACVIPPDHRHFYDEKVVYLPWSYQANDSRKVIGQKIPGRAECGLPLNAFVFCCFNNCYKITPPVFDAWMKVLGHVEGSVLWLLSDSPAAETNLKKEASSRGIDANRLIFAERFPLPDHLARHQLADLFLDTLPHNAHTTASDALWAGLPVLTRIGETFAGRVAASLLRAVGLPELITRTGEEYEQLAITLATHPDKLAMLRAKLAQNRLTTPLFDTGSFTRKLESAYELMYERQRANLPPDHIVVPP